MNFEIGKVYVFKPNATGIVEVLRGKRFKIISEEYIQVYDENLNVIKSPRGETYWCSGSISMLMGSAENLSINRGSTLKFNFIHG